jgi:uncharacterized protein YigE (DUF2233 family)
MPDVPMRPTPRHRSIVLAFVACLCALNLARPVAAQDHDATILELRWRAASEAMAVTLRLSAPVRYRTSLGGTAVTLDVWSVAGDVDRAVPIDRGVLTGVTLRRMTPGVVRLELGVREPVRFKVFTRDDLLTVTVFPQRMGTVPVPRSVAYQTLRVPTGAGRRAHARAHVVTIDPRAEALIIQPALGGSVIKATETTSAVASRVNAVAAINGNFYTEAELPVGLIVIDGRVLSTPFPRRAVFAIDGAGRPWIGAVDFAGRVVSDSGAAVPISAINRPPRWGGVALYTPEYGPATPWHALVALVRGDRIDTFATGRQMIPADGYALATAESQQHLLLGMVRGQTVKLDMGLTPPGIMQAVQGGPRLVRNGDIHIPYAWEGFGPGFYAARTARSAIGITHAGKVLFVTVDGRSRESSGMSLPELAALMRALGARDAMNLDGGGSATLVVGGRVVSALPRGGERTVSSILVAVPRPQDSP